MCACKREGCDCIQRRDAFLDADRFVINCFCDSPTTAPAFPSLEGWLLVCVASDVQCQPCVSRALIHSPPEPSCTAGLAGCCCHTAASLFHRRAAEFRPLEGPCEFSSVKQAHLFAAFPSFIIVRVKPKHFPHSLGRRL